MKSILVLAFFLIGTIAYSDSGVVPSSKIVCDSKRGVTPIKFEIIPTPLMISILEQNSQDPNQWDATPYWDGDHRCGTIVSDDDLKTTKCDVSDDSSEGFFNLSYRCYNLGGDPSNPYIWGDFSIRQNNGSGILNCVSRHFKLSNCK